VVGAINIATGVATSVNALYEKLAACAGVARPPQHGPPRPGEQRRSLLDPARAKARLQWTATTPLDEGLAHTLEWFRKEVGR